MPHRLVYLWQPREPSLGQVQLLEELPNASVPGWDRWHMAPAGKMVPFNAGYRTRIADDFDTIRMEEYLRWLDGVLAIGAVVDGVHKRLAKGDLRVIDPTADLIAVSMFL